MDLSASQQCFIFGWFFFWRAARFVKPYKSHMFCRTTHAENHASRWMRDLWSKGISLILAYLKKFFIFFANFDEFFRFSKKFGFWLFLVHPTVVLVLLSAGFRDALSPVCGIFRLWVPSMDKCTKIRRKYLCTVTHGNSPHKGYIACQGGIWKIMGSIYIF